MTGLLLMLGLAACADAVVAPEMVGINMSVVPVSNGVTVSPSTPALQVNDTVQLEAYDDNGNTVRVNNWSSDNSTVATVSSSGIVTARAAGVATIIARANKGRWGTSVVAVVIPSVDVASVEVSPEQASLSAGSTTQLTATVKDANGKPLNDKPVAWKSSNAAVATVTSSGVVAAVSTGSATITATSDGAVGEAEVTITSAAAPPAGTPGAGIWISKGELDALPMSGAAWSGTKELKPTADASWTVQPIEQQSGQVFHVQAMAGALVFARLHPDPSAEAYRKKVAQAIQDVIVLQPVASSVTAPSRHLGAWAITADLIGLPTYDPALDTQFRTWLKARLDHPYDSSPKTIRLAAKQRPNNIGSWSRFSLAAASVYLGDTSELDALADVIRFWLGVKPLRDPFDGVAGGWGAGAPNYSNTWQENPNDKSTWRGIVRAGVVRDGNNFDGIQPEDHWRNATGAYDAATFPGDQTDHRYPEESLEGMLGAVLIMHRAGYVDLVGAADNALLRAARSIKLFADKHPEKGYFYFTGPHEASRPLINYFYPAAGMPGERGRNQLDGRAKGFAWTYWTHAGRSINQ